MIEHGRTTLKQRSVRRWLILVGLAVLLLTVIVTVVILFAPSPAHEVARWKEIGGTSTLADYYANGPAPEERARPLYLEAHAQFADLPDPQKSAIRNRSLTAELREGVRHAADAIELALQASARPSLGQTTGDGLAALDTVLDDFAAFRDIGLLLLADAAVAHEEDRIDRAIELLVAVCRLAGHVGEGPGLHALLVAMSIDAMVAERLEALLDDPRVAATALQPIVDAQLRYDALLLHAVLTEGAVGYEIFENEFGGLLPGLIRDANLRIYLQQVIRAAEIAQRPSHLQEWDDLGAGIPPYAMFIRFLIPSFQRAAESTRRHATRNDLLATAVDVQAVRDESGQYPQAWDMPADPVTGRPMQYERTDRGFTVRSDSIFDGQPIAISINRKPPRKAPPPE